MTDSLRFERTPLKVFAEKVRREVEIEPTRPYRTIGCKLYGQGVYQRETKIGTEIKAKRMFSVKENDLIINRIWAQKGSVGIVPHDLSDSVVTQDFPVFTLDKSKVIPKYIAWYVKTRDFWEECRRHSHGTSGRQRLSPKEVPNVTFPICTLHEQQLLVSKIEEVMLKIENARNLNMESAEKAENILNVVSGELYDTLSIRGKMVKLAEISERITDGTHQTPMYLPEGVPFLSVKDITSGRISFSNVRYISEEEHRELTKKCKPERGDILLTKVGTTGYAKVVDVDREFSIFVSLCLIKLKKDIVLPKYVEHMLNSSSIRKLSAEYTRGVGNKNLVLKFIEEFPIPSVTLQTQERVCTYLDRIQRRVNELESLHGETGKGLEELASRFLEEAFGGRL